MLTGFGLRFDRAGGIGRRALLLVACFERLYALFQRVDLLQQCLVDRIVGTSLRRRVTVGRLRHFATRTHERGHRNDCRNLIGPPNVYGARARQLLPPPWIFPDCLRSPQRGRFSGVRRCEQITILYTISLILIGYWIIIRIILSYVD